MGWTRPSAFRPSFTSAAVTLLSGWSDLYNVQNAAMLRSRTEMKLPINLFRTLVKELSCQKIFCWARRRLRTSSGGRECSFCFQKWDSFFNKKSSHLPDPSVNMLCRKASLKHTEHRVEILVRSWSLQTYQTEYVRLNAYKPMHTPRIFLLDATVQTKSSWWLWFDHSLNSDSSATSGVGSSWYTQWCTLCNSEDKSGFQIKHLTQGCSIMNSIGPDFKKTKWARCFFAAG